MIDVCFNCTHESFQKDLDDVLQRASAEGVTRMVAPASSLEDSYRVVELVKRYPERLSAAVGVHPHLARQWDDDTFARLRELIKSQPLITAVGETGLDYHRNYSPPEKQHHAFERQIHLAESVQLPMFLHQRDAHEDFLALLAPRRDQLSNAVVHCFTGNQKELSDYIDLDLYIGVTGWICDERRGTHLKELIRQVPENRLLIETDAPYLLPRSLPTRPAKRRNEPAFLTHVVAEIAACLNVPAKTPRVFSKCSCII